MASARSLVPIRALALLYLFFSTACAVHNKRQVGQCGLKRWTKIGCYATDWNEPALQLSDGTLEYTRLDDLSIKSCRHHCSNFEYSGLTDGTWCYCGSSVQRPLVSDEFCNKPCAGKESQNCGGEGRMKIYKKNGFASQSSPLPSSNHVSSSIGPTSSDIPSSIQVTTTSGTLTLTTPTSSEVNSAASLPVSSSAPNMPSSTSSSTSWSSPSSSSPTAAASCRGAFRSSNYYVAAVTSCFTGFALPQFDPVSAYGCVEKAPGAFCPTTAACVSSTAPMNLVVNGDFESGVLAPWTLWSASPAIEVYMKGTIVSGEVSPHFTGGWLFKWTYNNGGGASRYWKYTSGLKLEPGARYEVSYWWYVSTTGQCNVETSAAVQGGGLNVFLKTSHLGLSAGSWTKSSQQFVAVAWFADLVIGLGSIAGGAGCTIYIDDVTVKKVVT
ncbi:hypothetical protein V8F20_010723 [Naviculisporaceae sp. PSN 640]